MEKEEYESIIAILEHIKKRPYMYISKIEGTQSDFMLALLKGFRLALETFINLEEHLNLKNEIAREKGFTVSSGGIIAGLREKFTDEEEIVDWLLEIEIEAWQRELNS